MQPTEPTDSSRPDPVLKHELKLMPHDPTLKPSDASPQLITPKPVESEVGMATAPVQSVMPELPQTPATSPIPAPTQPTPPVTPDSQSIQEPTEPTFKIIKTPWLKIAILGFLAPTFVGISTYLMIFILSRFAPSLGTNLIRTGILQFILVSLTLLTAYKVYRILDKWVVLQAGLITVGTIVLIVTSSMLIDHLQAYSFTNMIASGGDAGGVQNIAAHLSGFIIPIASVVGLVGLTFIFNNLDRPPKAARVGMASVLVLLPYFVTLVYTPQQSGYAQQKSGKSSSSLVDQTSVMTDWVFRPTTLPQGVTGLQECNETPARFFFECDFYFTNYPGYLTPQSQQKITASISPNSDNRAMLPSGAWVTLRISKYDDNFKPYIYKDGRCDIWGLSSIMTTGTKYREENAKKDQPKLEACTKETTPTGITLYRNDITQPKLKVPSMYYFIAKDSVIILDHNMVATIVGSQDDAYFNDPNYKQQLYAFVDSLKQDK